MFDHEITINRFMRGYLSNLVADMSDEELTLRHNGKGHAPLWVLGHLAITSDFAGQLLGLKAISPKDWRSVFGPGSPDDVPDPQRFTKENLMQVINDGYERLYEPARNADPEAMAAPQAFPFFEGTPIKTIGDTVTLLLTSHFAVHAGQLSYWRRLQDRPPLF